MGRLHEQASSMVGDRLPLSVPQLHQLKDDFKPIEAHIQMEGGFSTRSKSRKEKVGRSWEKVGEKRTWYTLFIGKKDVYDYVDKYEKRRYDNADIPSIYSVVEGWLSQIEGALHGYSAELQGRVKQKLDDSYEGVVTSQRQSFSEFKQRLEEAASELDASFRENVAPWEQLKLRHDELYARIKELSVQR